MFYEKFVLPVLAASVIPVVILNPLKLDLQSRIASFVAVAAVAFLACHQLDLRNNAKSPSPTSTQPFAPASVVQQSGPCSANVDGSGNRTEIKCD